MTLDSDPRSGTLQKFCPDFIDQPVAARPGDDQRGIASWTDALGICKDWCEATPRLFRMPEQRERLDMTSTASPASYVLGSTDAEQERLIRQPAILDPFTERLFRDAGIPVSRLAPNATSGNAVFSNRVRRHFSLRPSVVIEIDPLLPPGDASIGLADKIVARLDLERANLTVRAFDVREIRRYQVSVRCQSMP